MTQLPDPPPEALQVFGGRLALACRLVALLGTTAVEHGLLGPREVERLWDRHVLNCAVLADLLPIGARVVDVGTGAGLPGLALAIRRPDLRVDLVESLQRRVHFVRETVEAIGLADQVRVVHGRAEDLGTVEVVGHAEWVTARAVAPLGRLVRWCLPLLRDGGTLLAMKGERADEELRASAEDVARAGGVAAGIVSFGEDVVTPPVRVVRIRRATMSRRAMRAGKGGSVPGLRTGSSTAGREGQAW